MGAPSMSRPPACFYSACPARAETSFERDFSTLGLGLIPSVGQRALGAHCSNPII